MNIKRVNLVNTDTGFAVGQIDFTMDNGYFVFKSYEPHSWDNECTVLDKNFFAKGNVKWDACSHFTFNGEDYPHDNDNYYHICGVSTYLKHMRMMQFILEVASIEYGDRFFNLELKELEKLRKLELLSNYSYIACVIEDWELETIIEEWNK